MIAEEVAAGLALAPTTTTATATTAAPMLKTHFKREPACQEFGSGQAEIIDFGVLDVERHPTAIIGDEAVVTFVNEVRFCASVADPILTFTVRDVKGNEITGTNTMFAQRSIGPRVAGDTVRVEFTQPLSLKNGHYSVSFSCTEFVDSGLVVHHRLYDVIMVQSITTRRFVGIFDPLSRITIAHS